jgi:uncharacterized membrane protein
MAIPVPDIAPTAGAAHSFSEEEALAVAVAADFPAAASPAVAEASAAAARAEAGNPMNSKQFLTQLQHDQIVQAIKSAEEKTTGQIHVIVTHASASEPLAQAQQHFQKLQLHESPHKNNILIFVAPRSQTFAVVGDQSIHQKIGDQAWQALAKSMADHFKNGQFMSAILFGIDQAGQLLTAHFPK